MTGALTMDDVIERVTERMKRAEHVKSRSAEITVADLTAILAHVEELTRERDGLAAKVYRPGVLRCAKCNFRLVSSTLHVNTGQISARDTTEHCPNDGSPMWRLSWEEECKAADKLWDEQFDRATKAESALAEAVKVLGPFAVEKDPFEGEDFPTVIVRYERAGSTKMPGPQWSAFRAARTFIDKHEDSR